MTTISKNARAMMETHNISADEFERLTQVDITTVENFIAFREREQALADATGNAPDVDTTAHAIPVDYTLPEDFNPNKIVHTFGAEKKHHDFTGLTVEEVFAPENQLNPLDYIKFGYNADYLNMPGDNKHIMEQLGRALAQVIYGGWELRTEWDNEDTPDHQWIIDRVVNGKTRMICARLRQFIPKVGPFAGKTMNKAAVEEWLWSPANKWISHKIQGRTNAKALGYHEFKKREGWLIVLTKYHWIGLWLRILAGLGVGRDMKTVDGISLTNVTPQTVTAMQRGYRSELFQLSGYDYSVYRAACRMFEHNAHMPIENPQF